MDKSANAHICSDEYMFTDNIYPIIYNVVATIVRKDIIQKEVNTGIWSCTDDEVKLHTNKLNNILYFLDSPVNILSEN